MASCIPDTSGSAVVDSSAGTMAEGKNKNGVLATASAAPSSSAAEDPDLTTSSALGSDDAAGATQQEETREAPTRSRPLDEEEKNQTMPTSAAANTGSTSSATPNAMALHSLPSKPPPPQMITSSTAAGASATSDLQRPKVGGKAPRRENSQQLNDNHNRNPASLIGDGYSKLVSDLRMAHELLDGVLSSSSSGSDGNNGTLSGGGHPATSSSGGEEVDKFTIQQRLETIQQSAKSLSQSQQISNNHRNLPSAVASVLEFAEKRWGRVYDEQMRLDVDGRMEYAKPEGDLQRAKEMMAGARKLSRELAEKLEVVVQGSDEKTKEGEMGESSAEPAMATARVNGSNAASNAANSKPSLPKGIPTKGPKGKRAAKSLPNMRQSFEKAVVKEPHLEQVYNQQQTQQLSQPEPGDLGKIQFLATQSGGSTSTKDLDKRVTFDGNICDRFAAVPHEEGVAGLEKTLASMKSSDTGGDGDGGSSAAVAYPVSGEAMNGTIFPTMAPPMMPDPTMSTSMQAELESKLTSKKKKRKRKREKSTGGSSGNALEDGGGVSVAGSEVSGPKRKRSRGKKSEGKAGKGSNTMETNDMKLPPPSPRSTPRKIISKSPRMYGTAHASTSIRTLPDLNAPRPPPQYEIIDDSPKRMHNPLLRLPQFPDGPDPPIEEIPQAGELWNLANIHYSEADTYPISYLARVLGFDVPEEGVGQKFGAEFDPMEVGRFKDESGVERVNSLAQIDSSFCHQVWKRGQQQSSVVTSINSDINAAIASSALAQYDNGMLDDLNLSYCDPLWANILSSYKGYNDDEFKDAGKGFFDELSPHCLAFAKERGVLPKEEKDGMRFRFAGESDEESLMTLADKCQWKSQTKHDIAACLRSQTHFCIVAELPQPSSSSLPSSQPIAFLQYRFCWYRAEENKVGVSTDRVSELVIFIDNLVYNDGENIAASSPTASSTAPAVILDADNTPAGDGSGEEHITTTNASAPAGDGSGEEPAVTSNASATATATAASATATNAGGDDSGDRPMANNKMSVSTKELETAKVLLISLALVHAARAGVWYGMMESPAALVPFLTKYFRMSEVCSRQQEEEKSSNLTATIPLVVDIKKCHFKYSILLLEEGLKSSQSPTIKVTYQKQNQLVNHERMVVHLNSSANLSMEKMSQSQGGVRFTNPNNDETHSKKAHVRMVRQPDNTLQLFSVSSSASDGGSAKEALQPIDPSSLDASNWNIVRLFPLHSSEQELVEGGKQSSSDSPNDSFLMAELKKKQSKLLSLESSIETTAQGMLSTVYDEHAALVNGKTRTKRERDRKKLEEYRAVQKRLEEAELAWQAQLDQDMDAVCDVCFDGEVTPDNQIIFCDACNVAVHQRCYGIDQIPSGNFFCHTCTYFEVDKEYLAARRRDGPPTKITRHKIVCELCPRRQGAFVQVQTTVPTRKAKWVHVGCAKWQGMHYVDVELKDRIEDLTLLKNHFKAENVSCTLCKSSIGALHKCREEGCNKWMHLTCARSLGKCSVQHGENCEGFYDPESIDHPPWSLACPKHSDIDPESVREGSLTTEQLVAMAESYPPEPAPIKEFYRMNATERKEYWSDRENLREFFEKVMPSLDGVKCALCEGAADPSVDKRCDKCGVFSHADCADPFRGNSSLCLSCRYTEDYANDKNYEEPYCHMCSHPNESGGPLLRTYAKPVSMKVWKGHTIRFQRSIFGKNKFVHALCGMWNPLCETRTNETLGFHIDCCKTAMSNGKDHVSHQHRCLLCGLYQGAKVDCCVSGCVAPGARRAKCKFHVTCARQAGLQVLCDDFKVKCFNHVECTYVLRARLEDLREIELNRSSGSGKVFNAGRPISWTHASSLFHAAVDIMRTLGWAWRWGEWWVESGDNWEPLLEEGQVEAEMTQDELKIVPSDPQSRCRDARQCRLAAFGAALRNRDYDKEDGDDQEPLERALTAILSTKSLVGPLKKKEIEFFVTWLALAYRSKSRVLGFGDDKTPVAPDFFCVHQDDGTPKYELGARPLPGKAEPLKGAFEPTVKEPDDYLKTPVSISPTKKSKSKAKKNVEAPDAGTEPHQSENEPHGEEDDHMKAPATKKNKKRKQKSIDPPDTGDTKFLEGSAQPLEETDGSLKAHLPKKSKKKKKKSKDVLDPDANDGLKGSSVPSAEEEADYLDDPVPRKNKRRKKKSDASDTGVNESLKEESVPAIAEPDDYLKVRVPRKKKKNTSSDSNNQNDI